MKQHITVVPMFVRWFTLALMSIIVVGCADLSVVRDFSKQSASLTSAPEAIDYWGGWSDRSKQYDAITAKLPLRGGSVAKGPTGPKAVPSKEEIEAVKSLQSVLSAYMTKLGALADDNLVDVSKQVDGLVDNLNKLPTNLPEEKSQEINAAYGAIIKLVRQPLDTYRHYKIRAIIQENDGNIQLLTESLSLVMASVGKFSEQEKNSVMNWYEIITLRYPAEQSFSSAYQWGKNRDSIVQVYQGKSAALESYRKALQTIGESHHMMAKDLDSFNSDSFKRLSSSLNDARDQIISARDKYRKAFE